MFRREKRRKSTVVTPRCPSPTSTPLLSISWPSVLLCHLLPYLNWPLLFPPPPFSLPEPSLPLPLPIILLPLLNRTGIHTLVFLLLEFHMVCELYLGCSKFLGKYPLISEYIPCVFFCDWVTSLRMIFSTSIHLPKNFRIHCEYLNMCSFGHHSVNEHSVLQYSAR